MSVASTVGGQEAMIFTEKYPFPLSAGTDEGITKESQVL